MQVIPYRGAVGPVPDNCADVATRRRPRRHNSCSTGSKMHQRSGSPTYTTGIGLMEKTTMAITTGTFIPHRELTPNRYTPNGDTVSLLD